jgi:hypothetical protein
MALDLPADLVTFLRERRQLAYDPAKCEAGRVLLLSLDQLRVQRFPTDTQSTEIEHEDPHRGEGGCYLVEGVNLVAGAEGYDPIGLLLWFPAERRFGTWDSSHTCILTFDPEVRWTHIADAPWKFINAQWIGAYEDSASAKPLRPWDKHEFSPKQMHEPCDPK